MKYAQITMMIECDSIKQAYELAEDNAGDSLASDGVHALYHSVKEITMSQFKDWHSLKAPGWEYQVDKILIHSISDILKAMSQYCDQLKDGWELIQLHPCPKWANKYDHYAIIRRRTNEKR